MPLKLSICIPTYNRLSDLKTCVGFLLPQVAAEPATVEIVIVDNASTDGTAAYIDQLADQHPFFRVFHNPINVGLDGNTVKCVEYARGEYMALLSDDDFYLEGEVENILQALAPRPYSLIRLNYHTFLEDPHVPYQTFQPERDVFFTNPLHMYDMRRFHNGGHFSGIIYRIELVQAALAELQATAPLSVAERSRGVYGELERRVAKMTDLPAFFIGKRLLATSIPQSLSYPGLEHVCLDHMRICHNWLSRGVLTPEDYQTQKNVTIGRLPQMIVTFTPGMSTADIVRVTNGLNEYLSDDARYRFIAKPLLYVGRFREGKVIYRLAHRSARLIKRTVLRRMKVLVR